MTVRAVAAITLATTLCVATVGAQRPDHAKVAREAMAKLAFLVGSWEGGASMDMGPGAKHEIVQRETVESRIDGLLLVVEGIGTKQEDGELVHHALAVISYDPRESRYRVVAYRQDGQTVDAVANFLPDGAFQWSFEITGQRGVRYTIRLSPDGEWLETGEITHDGSRWHPFLDMKLRRLTEKQ